MSAAFGALVVLSWAIGLSAEAKVLDELVISGGELKEPVHIPPEVYARGIRGEIWGPGAAPRHLRGPSYTMLLYQHYVDEAGRAQTFFEGQWTYYPALGGAVPGPGNGSVAWVRLAPAVNDRIRQVLVRHGGDAGELDFAYRIQAASPGLITIALLCLGAAAVAIPMARWGLIGRSWSPARRWSSG